MKRTKLSPELKTNSRMTNQSVSAEGKVWVDWADPTSRRTRAGKVGQTAWRRLSQQRWTGYGGRSPMILEHSSRADFTMYSLECRTR